MQCNVQDIKNGNVAAFKMVYHQYHNKLYFFVLKHTQSVYLAEETVQLTFIKLWEKKESLSGDYELSFQVFRIARSIMIDLLRKQSVQDRHMGLFTEESAALHMEFDLSKKEELQRVYHCIEQLSPVRRHVFKMSRFEGLSHKKIAEQLSISPRTVENHILRAVHQLKKALLFLMYAAAVRDFLF
ncbi:sigma-70 family RNA polymerase sigma factor [Chitinophaga lutea]|uniref:Sigma-70 family RNA polymerase sigma factor n=1 Tax=Chitinophaga lutea TaxID=2488634 RepID=A0A3N4PR82_9BACT|nr:sigma-70 family RNA polymerase sigma factor [Chitinophaga lutea]RPE09259.1 sigma-70 family RNA polymerase sigma factor [Chitinophaga lutea]